MSIRQEVVGPVAFSTNIIVDFTADMAGNKFGPAALNPVSGNTLLVCVKSQRAITGCFTSDGTSDLDTLASQFATDDTVSYHEYFLFNGEPGHGAYCP